MSLRDYFSNNRIFTGTEKPTQGKFGVGDIIVNIGPNSAEEPMWICVEAGTPGVWELCSGVNEEEIADIVQANALSSIDYTDGVDIQIDGGEIGNMNELQTTDKSSLVGAINELFQSANNGKELIANAIGEPLDSNDTFSAMSNDINGLLSTFKTNMMNSGVMVESSDKFKSLIDKIKGLTEGEGNKGVQFVQGISTVVETLTTYTRVSGATNGYYYIEIPNLTFEPLFIIAKKNAGAAICFINASLGFYYSWYNTSGKHITIHTYGDGSGTSIAHDTSGNTSIDFTNIKLPVDISTTGTWDWYAIGVGEEDTTLRDSLASILTEEGVSVTEEDDMASLISKVDEEFTKDNNTINNLNTDKTNLTNQVNSLTSELAGKVTPAGTAVAGNVLTGKTFINSTGQVVTGTMANQGAKTFTPSASKQTGAAGYYSSVTCNAVSNLTAANIKSGVTVGGVTGTYKGPAIKAGTTCQIHYHVNRITANTVIPDTDGDRYVSLGEFSYNTYTNNLMDMQSIRVRFRYATDDSKTFIGNSEEECENNDRYANPILMKVVHKRGSTTVKTVTKYGIAPRAGSNCDIDLSDVKKGDIIDFRVKFLNGKTAWEVIEYCALLCTTD